MIHAPDRRHPHHYYDERADGPYLLVPGTVFYDEVHVVSAAALEVALFEDLEHKYVGGATKRDPPLCSSFARRNRLNDSDEIVVDRLRVVLSTTHGWALDPGVLRWFCRNVELQVDVNRMPLFRGLLGEIVGAGYEMPMAYRHLARLDEFRPRDIMRSNDDFTGVLRVLRDPGILPAEAIVRVEAIGSWLIRTRRPR